MTDHPMTDVEDDGPDDSEAIAVFADELAAAVEAFGVPVLEPGEFR